MRQYDLFFNPVETMRGAVPYVVVLSSHLLFDLSEVIIAPVASIRKAKLRELEVLIEFEGKDLLIMVPSLTAIRASMLKNKVGSLLRYEDAIRRALERLFSGF